MNRLSKSTLCLFGGAAGAFGTVAVAQDLKHDIVGTWIVQAHRFEKDGKLMHPFGEHAAGYLIFTPGHHYSVHFVNSQVPKFATENRAKGTAQEIRTAYLGNLACFGTYSVDDDHSITVHLKGHNFPNWVGADQKRLIEIQGDRMTFTAPMMGGKGVATLKRLE